MNLLISQGCGIANFLECVELQTRVKDKFGENVVTTLNNTGRESLDSLIREIKEKNISHYLVSEGMIPLSFKAIKEECPNVTILKLDRLSREVLTGGEKISKFTAESRICELVEFYSNSNKLKSVVSDQEINLCRLTRHNLNPQQQAAINTHYPNAVITKAEQNFNNVNEILQYLKLQNADVVEVVLPPNMVMELLEKKPVSMQIIRAQMFQGREFQYYEEIEKTVTTMKEFG